MKICKCGNDSFIPVPTMIFFTKDYSSHCTVVCAKCGKDYTAKIEFQLENIDSEYSGLRDTIRRLQKEIAEYWKEIEDLKSKNQCFSDSSKILQRALEEERTRYDKLREELKDIKYKYDVEKTENYEIQKENEGLKAENEKLRKENSELVIENLPITKLNYEINCLKSNIKIMQKDTAEAKIEKSEIEKKLNTVHLFMQAVRKIEEKGNPVACLLKEIENILNIDSVYTGPQ